MAAAVLETFKIPISWTELLKRTGKEFMADDCLGLAAQLAYYFFLALFPTLLFLLALASFFPLGDFAANAVESLKTVAPPAILDIIREQIQHISDGDHGGLLTVGALGALWSSSAALISIVGALNRAYDIEEGRPWWKVRLVAIGLTLTLALLVLLSFALILAGPTAAESLAERFGLGAAFEWTWKILQWPIAFALVTLAVGIVYHFGPDAEQSWEWVSPGAVVGTALWLLASLAFKLYVSNFTDYNAAYGTIGGVMVLLLWFYISGLALLAGAEMNAEIEHASPYGKEPGEKVPGQRKKLGRLAARDYEERQRRLSPATKAKVAASVAADVARAQPTFVTKLAGALLVLFRPKDK